MSDGNTNVTDNATVNEHHVGEEVLVSPGLPVVEPSTRFIVTGTAKPVVVQHIVGNAADSGVVAGELASMGYDVTILPQ